MAARASALDTADLVKRYRGSRAPALDGVTLSVPAGSFTALVGPNGAGKSTLIRTFMGFERPTSGTARVTGIDATRHGRQALAAIGYVGQKPGLYPELSAKDHLALAASLRRSFDTDAALGRLGDLGIELARPAGKLSGGQQAQLGLALAIGTRAPVLLLDEPLASLDPLARREFLGIVAEAVAGGATAMIASHIVGDLDGFCDRIIVLAAGRVPLDSATAWAQAHHLLVPFADVDGREVIGTFADQRGALTALVRSERPTGGSASLEEIVLGYLAAARGHGRASEPAA